MKTALIVFAITFLLIGCSNSPAPETPKASVTVPTPADESSYFPKKDLAGTRVVANHILDPSIPYGGTAGDYGKYQVILVRAESGDKAAFLLLDGKKLLEKPRYLAHMGGYFGTKDGAPVYVFAKGSFLVWMKGLDYEAADVAARIFAARLPSK